MLDFRGCQDVEHGFRDVIFGESVYVAEEDTCYIQRDVPVSYDRKMGYLMQWRRGRGTRMMGIPMDDRYGRHAICRRRQVGVQIGKRAARGEQDVTVISENARKRE
jgi:hypothetical protein